MPRRLKDAAGATPQALGQAVRRLARATQKLEQEALSDSAVTRAQAIALLTVSEMGQPAMSMLARSLRLAPSTLTRLVDPLVDQGLLRRDASPEDRRIVVVGLTGTGKKVVRRVESQLDRAYAEVVGHTPAAEQTRLQRTLQSLIEAFERHELRR